MNKLSLPRQRRKCTQRGTNGCLLVEHRLDFELVVEFLQLNQEPDGEEGRDKTEGLSSLTRFWCLKSLHLHSFLHKRNRISKSRYFRVLTKSDISVSFFLFHKVSYRSLTVNWTPVFNTRGLCGWVGMQGCLSTTRELHNQTQ